MNLIEVAKAKEARIVATVLLFKTTYSPEPMATWSHTDLGKARRQAALFQVLGYFPIIRVS